MSLYEIFNFLDFFFALFKTEDNENESYVFVRTLSENSFDFGPEKSVITEIPGLFYVMKVYISIEILTCISRH